MLVPLTKTIAKFVKRFMDNPFSVYNWTQTGYDLCYLSNGFNNPTLDIIGNVFGTIGMKISQFKRIPFLS